MERNVRVLGFAAIVRAFGLSLIGPFLALYFHNILGIGFAEVGLIAVAVALPPLALTPLAGLASDRIGRRRVFLASLVGEAVCLLGLGAAMARGSFWLVFLGFSLFSLVSNFGGPAVSAYVADFTQGSDRTEGFTWFRVGHNIGFTLGVLVGGALVGFVGFVPVALAGGVFAAATAAIALVWMGPTPYDLALAFEGPSGPAGPGPARRPGSLGTSLRVLARDRVFLTLCLAFGLATIVAGQWAVTFPLFVVDVLHVPYAVLGAGLALNGFIVVVGQTAMTRGLLGRRHTAIAAAGTIAYAAGFLLLALAGAFELLPLLAFFAAVLVLTVGENLLWIPQSTLPSNVAPPTEVGSYNGAFQTVGSTGVLIATAVGGFALAAFSNPLELWLILIAPVVPAVLLLQYAGDRVRPDANQA
jgi:MFS family permease